MINSKNLRYAFCGSLLVIFIGCFLTYFSAIGISTNYISYDGDIKDGVFLIVLGVIAALCFFKGKHILSLVFQLISCGIFVFDFVDTREKIKEIESTLSIFGGTANFGIGFYVVLIGLVVSIVTLILTLKVSRDNK